MLDPYEIAECEEDIDSMSRQIVRGGACILLLIIAVALGAMAALN